jgi:hypothetical protein
MPAKNLVKIPKIKCSLGRWISTDVSKEHVCSTFKVEENAKQRICMNQVAKSCWFLTWPILWPYRKERIIPPKRLLVFNELHGIISQKRELLVITTVRTRMQQGWLCWLMLNCWEFRSDRKKKSTNFCACDLCSINVIKLNLIYQENEYAKLSVWSFTSGNFCKPILLTVQALIVTFILISRLIVFLHIPWNLYISFVLLLSSLPLSRAF